MSIFLAPERGPKGDVGQTGPQGEKGNTGAKGAKGAKGDPGDEVEIRNNGEYVQWKYTAQADSEWKNIVAITALKGATGQQGPQGATGPQGPQGPQGATGANGKQIELTKTSTHIKWRYSGQAEGIGWTPLIAVEDLKGEVTNVHEHTNLSILQDLKYKFWCGTKSEYNKISTKEENTIYFIKE